MNKKFDTIYKKIKQKVNSYTDKSFLSAVLSAILSNNDFWQIVKNSNIPLPVVCEIIKILKKEKLINYQNKKKIVLTSAGIEFCKQNKISEIKNFTCPICKGRTVNLIPFKDIYNKYFSIIQNRPKPLQKYDQGYVTPKTSISRVIFMHSNNDITNKKIIVLGDDDLVGIAISLFRKAEKVVVIDIDDRIIDFTNKIAEKENLNLEAIKIDLRKQLPKKFHKKFDVFTTDPVETLPALKTFIGKGLYCLNSPGSSGYFGITNVEASVKKWSELQKILINDFKTTITAIIPKFSAYINWDYNPKTRAYKLTPVKTNPSDFWYFSTFYRIQTLKGFKYFNKTIKGNIYNDTESSTV